MLTLVIKNLICIKFKFLLHFSVLFFIEPFQGSGLLLCSPYAMHMVITVNPPSEDVRIEIISAY